MIDVNGLVEPLLTQAGVPVYFSYPEQFTDVPAISFYNLSDTAGFRADDSEWAQEARVQVDIWADRAIETGKIGTDVDAIMQRDGWIREYAADLPKQTDDQLFHRTMRFAKEIYY